MRIYPPPPSTAPRSDRHWQLRCEECGKIEYYPDIFARSTVLNIIEYLAVEHVCSEDTSVSDWAEDRFLVNPMHPGYAGR